MSRGARGVLAWLVISPRGGAGRGGHPPQPAEPAGRGKTDVIDAEAAARAVLSGDASVTPKAQNGQVEALRQLRVARAGAMKARTAAANQLHSLCDTAPDPVRAQLVLTRSRSRPAARPTRCSRRRRSGTGCRSSVRRPRPE